MQLIDTHCHIHFDYFTIPKAEVLANAAQNHVTKLLCVGCTLEDSSSGIAFVSDVPSAWAAIGLHPHEADNYVPYPDKLAAFADLASKPKVVAVGECGLDYYYEHSSRENQRSLFTFQLELALKHQLPLIFHVRDAFEDFFEIVDKYPNIRGVVHSFSAGKQELEGILQRNLFVGINGIMTFTKKQEQLDAAKAIPLEKMMLETDAPYLTPKPFRGTMCEPKYVLTTAQFMADLRGESLEELAAATTANAEELFRI